MMNNDILKSQTESEPSAQPSIQPSTQPSAQGEVNKILGDALPPQNSGVQAQNTPHVNTEGLPTQKPIRTYESDVAEILAKQKASMISMAAAENERKLAEQAAKEKLQQVREEEDKKEEKIKTIKKTHRFKKLFLTLVSLIFICAGLGGGYYFYLNSPVAPAPIITPSPVQIPSIIKPDSQKTLDVTSLGKNQIAQSIRDELIKSQVSTGQILEIVPIQKVGTSTIKLTGSQFIEATSLKMPDSLQRSLTDRWMMGVYSADGINFPFIILTSDFFQNTFAGMLRWETTMPDELADLLNFKDKANIDDDNASSSISSLFTIRGNYSDKIIRNRDIREFTNSRGEILFLYTFIDQETVVITTSEAVIPPIVDRVEKQSYIR